MRFFIVAVPCAVALALYGTLRDASHWAWTNGG